MAFAILRFAKLKTLTEVAASGSHTMRTRATPNADPARTASNKILTGTSDPASDVQALLGDGPQRKNGVLAIEVLATTSPEWWGTATRDAKNAWVKSTREWLAETFGQANLAHVQLHLDETTPHITGLVVPRDPDTGRLNAARWLDGSAKLAALQTGYAKVVQPLGLVRGLEGSDAKHTTIKQFYGAMKAETPTVPGPAVAAPPAMIREGTRKDWAEGETKRLAQRQGKSVKTLTAQARAGVVAMKKLDAYKRTAERFRDAAQAARDMPLQEVAQRLTLERVRGDKSKWADAEGRFSISINNQQWFDHRAGVGRGGAIDLVQHVLGTDFKGALSWLGHHVGQDDTARAVAARAMRTAQATVKQAAEQRPPFVAPVPAEDPAQAQRAMRYVVGKRGVPAPVAARAAAAGDLYTDQRGNAVFLLRDAGGTVQGAELRGTGARAFHGLAPGSSRDAVFAVPTQSGTKPEHLVVVESATDALSYAALHPRENALVVSTAGTRPSLPRSVQTRLGEFQTVTVAFDNDAPGHGAAERLMDWLRELGATVRRAVPAWGKDWNDTLKAAQEAAQARQAARMPPAPSRPTEAAPEPSWRPPGMR